MRVALPLLSRMLLWLSLKLTDNFSSELQHTEVAGRDASLLIY
jgi:hypothetical protein